MPRYLSVWQPLYLCFGKLSANNLTLELGFALHDVTAGALKRLSEDILLTLSSTEMTVVPVEYFAPPASVASTNEHAVVSSMTHQSRSAPHLIRSHMLGEEV